MSGIFGVFRRDCAPVEEDRLARMQQAISFWGPDGAATWHSGPAGLGHLLRHNTPEARYEAMPIHNEVSGRTMTAAARLDNYDELCHQFEIPAVERPTTPDGRLVWLAYERWGEECVDHLFGDWSFAVWDARARRLFVARDHHGNTSLYTYQNERFFAFASSVKALLCLPEVTPHLNDLRLAQILSGWITGDGWQTVYKEIRQLPPAHQITVSAQDVLSRRYWHLEQTPLLHLSRQDEYIEGFVHHFRRAVQARLRSAKPVGTTLSGGLDSGAVTTLAAQLLLDQRKALLAYGAVPAFDVTGVVGPNMMADEAPLMAATAAASPNVQLHFVRAEAVSPLAAMRRGLQIHDQPLHAASNLYWLHDLFQRACVQGLGTILTGQLGNGTISWTGKISSQPLSRLARNRQWRPAVKEQILQRLPGLYAAFKHRQSGASAWQAYSPISAQFAEEVRLLDEMKMASHDPLYLTAHLNPRVQRLMLIMPGKYGAGAIWAETGAAYGIDIRDPTADVKLMEFCLSIPDQHYRDESGVGRNLIRRAMTGIIPESVLNNRKTGLQAADIVSRMAAISSEVETLLDSLSSAESVIQRLDLPRMRTVWQKRGDPPTPALTATFKSILVKGSMAGMFLMDFGV